MTKRDEIDRIAWETIHAHVPLRADRSKKSSRPRDYAELGVLIEAKGFELAWGDFLHEFFFYRDSDFFAKPSPEILDVTYQALLAGAAEWLCSEFGLTLPGWINERRYFLRDQWDPWEDLFPELIKSRPYRIQKTPQAFLKRNIVFESRNLIAL